MSSSRCNHHSSTQPIYGIMSDCLPVLGFRRTYYIALAGIVGIISWSSIATAVTLSVPAVVVVMLLGNQSVASPDVMVDAVVAEHSRNLPFLASSLQALCVGSLSLCGVISTLSSGWLLHVLGVQFAFLVLTLTSATIILPACLGWLGERPVRHIYSVDEGPNKDMKGCEVDPTAVADSLMLTSPPEVDCFLLGRSCFITSELFARQRTLVIVACTVTACVLGLGALVVWNGQVWIIIFGILAVVVTICYTLFANFHSTLPVLAKVAIFIFLRESFQIDTDQVSDLLTQCIVMLVVCRIYLLM